MVLTVPVKDLFPRFIAFVELQGDLEGRFPVMPSSPGIRAIFKKETGDRSSAAVGITAGPVEGGVAPFITNGHVRSSLHEEFDHIKPVELHGPDEGRVAGILCTGIYINCSQPQCTANHLCIRIGYCIEK